MEEDKKLLLCINDSQSINENEFFWKTIEIKYEELKQEYSSENIKIVCYGGYETIEIDEEQLKGMIKRKRGHSVGHNLLHLSEYILQTKFHDNLIVISDGNGNEIIEAKETMRKHGTLKSSKIYLIGETQKIDEFSPFLIEKGSEIYSINSEGIKLLLKTEENDKTTILGIEKMNIKEFLENFNLIYNYITKPQLFGYSHFTKTQTVYNNQWLRNILLKEKSRLIYEYGKLKKGNLEEKLIKTIEENKINESIEIMNELIKNYYENINSETKELSLEEKIDKLIELCGKQEINNFNENEIQSNRTQRAKKIDLKNVNELNEEIIEEAQSIGLKQLIECPLSGEEDIPVLLFTDKNILDKIGKNIINEIINCPLHLLEYPQLIDKIKHSISGFIGLKSLKENNLIESPFDGKKIQFGLILSHQKECLEINKSTIEYFNLSQ